MKYLLIARHAKSSWDQLLITDKERGLSKRGKRDLEAMGNRLSYQHICPDRIFSSPARRARKTAFRYTKTLGCRKKQIVEKNELYLADLEQLLRTIETFPEDASTCLLVGHNPGLTKLVNFCGYALDNLPTCGVAVFAYTGTYRGDFQPKKCKLKAYMAPKLLGENT